MRISSWWPASALRQPLLPAMRPCNVTAPTTTRPPPNQEATSCRRTLHCLPLTAFFGFILVPATPSIQYQPSQRNRADDTDQKQRPPCGLALPVVQAVCEKKREPAPHDGTGTR